MHWLLMWHHSTPGLVRQHVRIQAAGYCQQLQDKAKLVTISKQPSIRGFRLVMLNAQGRKLAYDLHPEHEGTYDTRPTSVNYSNLIHDLAVQQVALELLQTVPQDGTYRMTRFLPERLIHKKNRLGIKRPDCLLWDDFDPLPVALEVENNPKGRGSDLDRTLRAAARSIERKLVREVRFVASRPTVIDTYREVLSEPLTIWRFDRTARKWVANKERWHVPEWVQKRFVWEVREDLFDSFLPY